MDADGGKIAWDQQLIQLDSMCDKFHEYNHLYYMSNPLCTSSKVLNLVEFKSVQQPIQLPIFAILL